AEDGIRDGHVTGVQTCALPISTPARSWVTVGPARSRTGSQSTAAADASQPGGDASPTNETTCVTPAACNSRQRPRDGTPAIQQQIGRASCRERVERLVDGISVK